MAYLTVAHPDGSKSIISGAVGQYVMSASPTPPAHTLVANGAAISRAAYPELFAAIGTTYGEGDGSTTFNLPDLQGKFIRGSGGNAAALGVEQGDAIRNISGTLSLRRVADGNQMSAISGVFSSTTLGSNADTIAAATGQLERQELTFNSEAVVPTATENRPINMAVTMCIVYE